MWALVLPLLLAPLVCDYPTARYRSGQEVIYYHNQLCRELRLHQVLRVVCVEEMRFRPRWIDGQLELFEPVYVVSWLHNCNATQRVLENRLHAATPAQIAAAKERRRRYEIGAVGGQPKGKSRRLKAES
jgi:hypothetical protein